MCGLFINHDKACRIRGQRKPFPAFRKSSHCRGFKTTPLVSSLSVMLKQMICRMPRICWQITYLLSAEVQSALTTVKERNVKENDVYLSSTFWSTPALSVVKPQQVMAREPTKCGFQPSSLHHTKSKCRKN